MPTKQRHILVVDDDPSMRFMIRTTLEQIGFEVLDVDSGEFAIEEFYRNPPDAVLLDVGLPGMDGYETCRAIRKSYLGQYTPIMMITGRDDVDSVNASFEAGATDFISKPMNWVLLGHRVQYMIRSGKAFQNLQHSERRLLNAKHIANIVDWEYDFASRELYWSDELKKLLSIDSTDHPDKHEDLVKHVHPEDQLMLKEAIHNLFKSQVPYDIEYRIKRQDDELIYVHEKAQIIRSQAGPEVHSIQGTIQNITHRKQSEQQIYQLAYYDSLTGLPNRAHFETHLTRSVNQAKRDNTRISVLMIGISNFKHIQDTLGHDVGDSVVKQVSAKLTTCLRDCDFIGTTNQQSLHEPLARVGGNEFLAILQNNIGQDETTIVAKRIIDVINEPILVNEHDIPVNVVVGISQYPDDATNAEILIKNAYTAMHIFDNDTKNHYCFYDEKMNVHLLRKLHLERDLQKAIAREEFILHYQPKIETASRKIVGSEALIRWIHPEHGFIPPDEFIGLAEEMNLIMPIGEWVFKTACAQNKRWQTLGHTDLHVAVNLSPKQFNDAMLMSKIQSALESSQLPPESLIIELTENVIMHSQQTMIHRLNDLKNLDIKLAVDDFGTGYSSLRYLSEFPLDSLKIDRSFISNVPENIDSMTIVESIIALAAGLKLDVVAEGVETNEQFNYLETTKCHQIQGYYFSKPLPADEFTSLLQRGIHSESENVLCPPTKTSS